MPRTCTICAHEKLPEINEAILRNGTIRGIASRFGVGKGAVERHKAACVSETLAKATEVAKVFEADSLLDRLMAAHRETKAILEEARASKDNDLALKALTRIEKQI